MKNDERLRANAVRVAAVLAAHGIAEITANYSGSGDEGQVDEVTVEWPNGQPVSPEPSVVLLVHNRNYSSGTSFDSITEESFSLSDAMELLTDDALEVSGHSGYHNGEGGEGSLCVSSDGGLVLDHSDFYTERATSMFELDPLAVEGSVIPNAAPALAPYTVLR